MPVGSGINTQFGGSLESTYGTPVTPAKFNEVVSEGIQLKIPRIESKSLRSGSRVERSTRWIANRTGADGPLSFEVTNLGMGWIFKWALGTSTITTPASGVLTRDHTYVLADAPPSATLQLGRPDVLGTIQPFTYLGAMCTDWELACDLDGLLMFNPSVDAMDETTATALATAVYPVAPVPFSYLGGLVQLGGVEYDVTKFSVKANNGLAVDRRFIRNSGLQKQPIPADFTDIEVAFDIELSGLTAYGLFTAGTLGTFSAAFGGAAIETVAGPLTYSYGCTLTAPVVRIDGATPTVSGPGIVTLSVTGKILHDPAVSANPITLVYRTTDVAD